MRYPVVIEWSGRTYAASSPDVPGCIAGAETLDEVKWEFQAALEFHFEGLLLNGIPIPQPTTIVDYVEVDVDALRLEEKAS